MNCDIFTITHFKSFFLFFFIFWRLAIRVSLIFLIIPAICKSALQNIQISYLRATQKFDFFCLFLALWLDILTLLTACGALARTLSTCLDAMTGGMARIYLLGRNSDENEPWPDVLGVSVVFLLTVMFMLGLEVINIRLLRAKYIKRQQFRIRKCLVF